MMIINNEVTKPYTTLNYQNSKNDRPLENEKRFKLSVTPEEMSSLIQSITVISSQLDYIKSLINYLKDLKLKQFFIVLFFKINSINLLYGTVGYYKVKDKMSELVMNRLSKFKSFILDLCSSFGHSYSPNLTIMLREALIMSFSLSGKFIFLPNSFDELHSFMKKKFSLNNPVSSTLIKSMSFLMFAYPSSLYLINTEICNELIKFENEINIHRLFSNSLLFIILELRFAKKIMNYDFIESIRPYIQSVFNYVRYLLNNEYISIIKTEQILSNFFGIKINNPIFSIMIEKELVEISDILFNKISKIEGVIQSDNDFFERNKNVKDQIISKQVKIIESNHPYKMTDSNEGVIDFGPNVKYIYMLADNKCDLSKNDLIYLRFNEFDSYEFEKKRDFLFNKYHIFETNKIKWKFNVNNSNGSWGFKLYFFGISFDNPYNWIPNIHLHFYNHFIKYLTLIHLKSFESINITEKEKEFTFILNKKLIQGIKLEEIDNYEENMIQNKPQNKLLKRGISRGISYDIDNDSFIDNDIKKSFINDLINLNEEKKTPASELLDILYSRTAKQNRIKLTNSTKSILENERYLAACLFKQLGLISICIKFIRLCTEKDEEIEIPNRLIFVWKNIYSLRKTLFFEYQKSKSFSNLNSNVKSDSLKYNFEKYSDEVKRKCKLLLYSDPILKFKEKEDINDKTIELAAKSIIQFVTSKTPLSNISEIIDIQRKRLSITNQSILLMNSFFEKKSLFKSSEPIFAQSYNDLTKFFHFDDVTQEEFDEFIKKFGDLSITILKNLLSNPSISTFISQSFIKNCIFNGQSKESVIESSKLFIEIIESNKKNQNLIIHDRINIILILSLLGIAIKSHDNHIIDYVISLLLSEEIDLQSKQIILMILPALKPIFPENSKVSDKSLAFSILSNSKESPIIVNSIFYWIATLNDSDLFIKNVLKGIGQSFSGESCTFINDSFSKFAHSQVAEGMISFIRLLIIQNNSLIFDVIHEILTEKISQIDDNIMISIGLFASIGQSLSAMEPGRRLNNDRRTTHYDEVNGFDTTLKVLKKFGYNPPEKLVGFYLNLISFDPKKIDLNEIEIENILNLHEFLNTDVFPDEKEDFYRVLIASFYSFLPVIMQNKNNAKLLLKNKRSLSLFEYSMNKLPSSENNMLILSHFLEKAINSPLYQANEKTKSQKLKFMRMNFGEIIYNNKSNDIIISDINHSNLFLCNCPLESSFKSYFELKINKIGDSRFFIGFVDCEEISLDEAFEFGYVGSKKAFCRRSPFLSKNITTAADKTMKENRYIKIKNGDRIGCFYTKEFVYLIINKEFSPYRLSHKSLTTYVPLILIDHDEIEFEVTENVVQVNEMNEKFDFLKEDSHIFADYDIRTSVQKQKYENKAFISEKDFIIGQQVLIDKFPSTEKKLKLESIDSFPQNLLYCRENYGIIKDISNYNENCRFVCKLKIETYNSFTLSKEIIDVDSRYVEIIQTNFFNLIENRTNTKFGLNASFDLNHLPAKYRNKPDFDEISIYMKKKTIKNNSKSISILMCRYLAFILVDYLRYSKSPLLQDDGIDSPEMDLIMKSLAISIPSITIFRPSSFYSLDQKYYNDYIIFPDESSDIENENEEKEKEKDMKYKFEFKPPGYSKLYSRSFKVFLKKSENFISKKFVFKLIKQSYENAKLEKNITSSMLYKEIPSMFKMESISPLPNEVRFKQEINIKKLNFVGFLELNHPVIDV